MSAVAAVGQPTAKVAVNTNPQSCGMKVSKALTIVGGILATSVALVEGSRFLDVGASFAPIADLFQHLPSIQTNVAIGVAAVSTMIAGQVLGSVDERRQTALANETAKVAKEAAANKVTEENERALRRQGIGKAIEGLEAVSNRVHEVHRHPQTKADIERKKTEEYSKYSDDQKGLWKLVDAKVPQTRLRATQISDADAKLNCLLNQAKRFLVQINEDDNLVCLITPRTIIHTFNYIPLAVNSLIDFRLNCLNQRAKDLAVQNSNESTSITDFEKTFAEIMSKIDLFSGEDPFVASIDKIVHILEEVEGAVFVASIDKIVHNFEEVLEEVEGAIVDSPLQGAENTVSADDANFAQQVSADNDNNYQGDQ